ncbi:MAG: methionyl-tRNA formyltransferase [Bacteroidota bacterium]
MNTEKGIQRNLRIVFLGTPEFAVAGLRSLVDQQYDIAGVVTAPDKPAGRGRKVQESAVKVYAKEQGITVLQPINLKDETFLATLKSLRANLQVVVAFRMLPKIVWQMPEYGTFNLHASLLPNYRGAAPINWAIINGETKTGATTFFIDEKIDTGKIILQQAIEITPDENAGNLHDKLMHLGAGLILETVRQIAEDTITPVGQENSENLKLAPKIYRDTCEINWSKPLKAIYDHIRGLSPYPSAWTTLVNDDDIYVMKIHSAEMQATLHKKKIGALLCDKKTVKIATKGGYLNLLEIQMPGKRKMKVSEVINGFVFSKKAYLR